MEKRYAEEYKKTLRHSTKPEQTKIQFEDDQLTMLITEIFTKSECRFGGRRIRAKLMQVGYTVSERRILCLMKEFCSAV